MKKSFNWYYERFLLPLWLVFLVYHVLLWTLNAWADSDIVMVATLFFLWILVLCLVISDILLLRNKESGKILNIISLAFDMGFTCGILGMKAWTLFDVDLMRALSSGSLGCISIIAHSLLMIHFIREKRKEELVEELRN